MNRDAVLLVLECLETPIELAEFDAASGLVIEVQSKSGDRELIGPYRKDTADVFAALERLRSEQSTDHESSNYSVKLLLPASHASCGR